MLRLVITDTAINTVIAEKLPLTDIELRQRD